MKPLVEIENAIRGSMQIRSISEIPELSAYGNYENIKNEYSKRNISFEFKYRKAIVNGFGSDGERLLFGIPFISPLIIVLGSILLAVFRFNLFVLLGIPLAILGGTFTSPGIMKRGSSLAGIVMVFSLVAGGYYFHEHFNIAFLFFSYGFTNCGVSIAQELSRQVFERAVLCSEIVFIHYFIGGEFALKDAHNNLIKVSIPH